MQMFETLLNSIPKNRSDLVNELEIPEVTLEPYLWDPDDSLTIRSESILTSADNCEVRSLSTDSSIPLSRAMTDSEIDYGRFRRFKSRSLSDPWDQMRVALDAFPPGYLDSLNSFQNSSEDMPAQLPFATYERTRLHNKELRLKMKRFFNEECNVFTPDDPGLEALQDALQEVDMKKVIG